MLSFNSHHVCYVSDYSFSSCSSVAIKEYSLFLESSFCSISTRWLVHDGNEKTRLCILRILYLLLKSNKVSDAAKAKIRLKGVGYDSVCTLLSKQSISRDVIIALLKLALSIEQTLYKGVDVYLHFDIVFATMHILRVQPLPVKLEVALKVSLPSFSHFARNRSLRMC